MVETLYDTNLESDTEQTTSNDTGDNNQLQNPHIVSILQNKSPCMLPEQSGTDFNNTMDLKCSNVNFFGLL